MEDEPEILDDSPETLISHNIHLIELLDDSEKRYEDINDTLEGVRIRNRQLSISLNKEKEERLRMRMAFNVTAEKADETRLSLNRNLEKVSQFENEIDELTQEKNELSEMLESEKEKTKLLQSELEIIHASEWMPSVSTAKEVDGLGTEDEAENENFLQNVVVKLKKVLDAKDLDCNELEDQLSVMRQELMRQGKELARASSEFEQQLSRLHDVLNKQRLLNNLLSEESDQTVRELQTKLQEKDELNTELQGIREQASERMVSIEEQCRFYRTKLKESEQSTNAGRTSVSCQVNERDLAALEEACRAECRGNEKVYQILMELCKGGALKEIMQGNSTRHKMNVVRLIQNGFKKFGAGKTKM